MTYRKKILIVDDDLSFTYSLEKGLKSLNAAYDIIVANGGRECLDRIKLNTPDLILLDIIMPKPNGWDVVEKLHRHKKLSNIPIIFLTGKDDVVTKTIAGMSIEDYIVKPVDINKLDVKIRRLLKLPM